MKKLIIFVMFQFYYQYLTTLLLLLTHLPDHLNYSLCTVYSPELFP